MLWISPEIIRYLILLPRQNFIMYVVLNLLCKYFLAGVRRLVYSCWRNPENLLFGESIFSYHASRRRHLYHFTFIMLLISVLFIVRMSCKLSFGLVTIGESCQGNRTSYLLWLDRDSLVRKFERWLILVRSR